MPGARGCVFDRLCDGAARHLRSGRLRPIVSVPLARPPEPRVSVRQAVRDSLRYTRRALGLVYRSSGRLTFALGGLTLGAAFVPPAIAWAGKLIVDAVVAHSREKTLRWVAVELGLVVL